MTVKTSRLTGAQSDPKRTKLEDYGYVPMFIAVVIRVISKWQSMLSVSSKEAVFVTCRPMTLLEYTLVTQCTQHRKVLVTLPGSRPHLENGV